MANDTLFRERAPLIMRRLMSEFGIDATSAAAIVGNLGHESSGFKSLQEIKPLVPGSRGGYGYAQWTGPRRVAYEKYCTENHLDPRSHDANVGFLVWELRNTEKTAIPAVKRAEGLHNKVVAFELAFERAASQYKAYPSREKWATLALTVYTPGGAVVSSEAPKAPASLPVPSKVPATKQDAKEVGWIGGAIAGVTGAWYAFWGSAAGHLTVVIAILAALAAIYWFVIRPILRRYWALDEVEGNFLTKLRLALKGVKTKLFSWLLGIAGIALPVLSMVGDVDLSAFLPDIGGVPASVYQYGILALIGWATNTLRNATTTPVGQTDLALAPSVEAPPLVPEIPKAAEPLPEIVKEIRNKRGPNLARAKKVKKRKLRA
jgi:hypothetical protein